MEIRKSTKKGVGVHKRRVCTGLIMSRLMNLTFRDLKREVCGEKKGPERSHVISVELEKPENRGRRVEPQSV